jgi:uncharacterized protein (TIGR00661 family)
LLIGSDGEALLFLKREFPEQEFIEMPSYNVRYPYKNMTLNMAIQLPGFLSTIRKENLYVQEIISKYNVSAIVSDNRYGLYSSKVPTVFITHQTTILNQNPLIAILVNRLNLFFLKKFDSIWIPDFDTENNLSGELGHKLKLPSIRYIGPLSRLEKTEQSLDYDIVAVLSGPEPQRTFFEQKLIAQLAALKLKSILIQGKTDLKNQRSFYNDNLEILPFADAETLSGLIKGAKLFISRSGYSTLMDLAKLGPKKLLLIPTPGQTEQEYLAKNMQERGFALVQKQSELNVKKAWEGRKAFKSFFMESQSDLLEVAVEKFLI